MTRKNGGSSYQAIQSRPLENEERSRLPDQQLSSVEIDQQELNHEQEQVLKGINCALPTDELVMSVDDAIERLGYGRFQRKILVAAGLCFAADSMEVLLLSFLAIVLKDEWDLTEDESASITSSVFAGAMCGTLVLGPLGDSWGRRPVFCLAALIISASGMATALAQNFHQLLAMRFVVGFGVGGLTVPFDTLAEFLPMRRRGKNLLYIEYFWAAGTLSVPIIAYLTLGDWGSWQWFVFLCALPCLASAIMGFFVVPESPRWLVTNGHSQEALSILRKAAAENGHANVDWLFPPGTQLQTQEEHHSSVCDLFAPQWRWLTVKLWGAWIGFAFGYYGTILAITQVFDKGRNDGRFMSSRDTYSENNGTFDFDYGAIFTSGAGEVLGTTIVILTVDRIGRVPSQVLSYAMGGICVCLLSILASDENNGGGYTVLVVLAFLARSFEMSGTCVTWISTAELLSTDIRTSGHSAANAIARLGGFASPFLVKESTSLVTIGVVMLCTHAFTVLCTSQLPETKDHAMGDAMASRPSQVEQTSIELFEGDLAATYTECTDEIEATAVAQEHCDPTRRIV